MRIHNSYIALILILLLSCSKKEEETLQGCMTGIRKGETQRTFIRCCTKQEHLAGDNVAAGGTSRFTYYTKHQWKKCDQCK